MLNLIEHVEDPVATMAGAAELLAPGGVAWLQTPDFHALDAPRCSELRNWAGLPLPAPLGRSSAAAGSSRRSRPRRARPAVSLRSTQGGAFWAASLLGVVRRRGAGGRGRPAMVRDPLFTAAGGRRRRALT